ncbi:MAG: metallophosphoesterase [Oscillospiraceae bacterium]
MRIQFVSDLHLEFKENLAYVQSIPFEVTGEILILAGDTFYLKDRTMPNIKFWKWASQNYQQVMLVPGNHEFYNNGDVSVRGDSWQYMFLDNVGYYYNKVVRIGDVDIILSTLWSHIPAENEFNVFRGMNDFCQILYDKHRLRIEDFNAEHEKCLAFIKQSVLESTAKHIVVVTHHLPTFQAIAKERINDSMNNAYVTGLSNFIADSRIDYWIYGHSHENIDTEICTTKIVSNQLGYLLNGKQAEGFSESRFIEL